MKQLQHQGFGGVRFESQRFRLLTIVVGCFVISVTFLLSSRPEAAAFDTRTLLSDSCIGSSLPRVSRIAPGFRPSFRCRCSEF